MAGGKAKTKEAVYAGASEILRNPKVKAFLESVINGQITSKILEREEALELLTSIARSNITDVCCITEDGLQIRPDLTEENACCIKEIIYSNQGVRIKLHSSLDAIKTLARIQGWEMPKQEGVEDIEINKPETDTIKLARKVLFVLRKAAAQQNRRKAERSECSLSDSGHSLKSSK